MLCWAISGHISVGRESTLVFQNDRHRELNGYAYSNELPGEEMGWDKALGD